jgi:hypothetical protein
MSCVGSLFYLKKNYLSFPAETSLLVWAVLRVDYVNTTNERQEVASDICQIKLRPCSTCCFYDTDFPH